MLFQHFHLGSAGCTDLGQVVRAQDADRIDDHREGDHQLNGRSQELARAERDAAHDHDRLLDTLAAQRGQQRGDDALGQRSEKPRNHRTKVERRCENDDILRVEHFVYSST